MLKDEIRRDFTNARKTGNTEVKNALEAIIAGILQKEKIEVGREVSDSEVIECITKEIKVQKEIVEMSKGRNSEKTAEAEKKAEILSAYLPKQMTEAEVLEIIKEADVYEDASPKTKGMIIKTVMPQLAGKFDKALVNPLVEKYLSNR